MKLTAKQTYKVVTSILEKTIFTQTELAKSTKVSWGRMNEIVQWLIKKNFVEKKNGSYELIDPAGLVALFQLNRDMNSMLIKKYPLRLSKKEILKRLPKKTILCLDTALEFYSNYWQSNRVCIYIQENSKQFKEIKKEFQPLTGGNTALWVFRQDIKPETTQQKNYTITTPLRTLIDMVCDNKSYYAKDLYTKIWKLKFEE